jgi:hypothetical protein
MASIEPYEVFSDSSRSQLLSHLPVLGVAIGPYELVVAVAVVRHTLCTQ